MKVGWDIVDWRFVVRLRAIRREYVLVVFLIFVVTVSVVLITAVALGMIAAGVMRSRDQVRSEMDSVLSVPMFGPAFLPKLKDFDPTRLPVGLVRSRGRFSVSSANELTRPLPAVMPTLFVAAGPYGCGKSTLTRMSAFRGIERIDPDAIARGFASGNPAREALHQRQAALRADRAHLVETTLAGAGMLRHMASACGPGTPERVRYRAQSRKSDASKRLRSKPWRSILLPPKPVRSMWTPVPSSQARALSRTSCLDKVLMPRRTMMSSPSAKS